MGATYGLMAMVLIAVAAILYLVKLALSIQRTSERGWRCVARGLRGLRRGQKRQRAEARVGMGSMRLALERLEARDGRDSVH